MIQYLFKRGQSRMTVKLSTAITNIERDILSLENRELILQFLEFMKSTGTSEKCQNNNLKAITAYSKFLGPSNSLYNVNNKRQILSFLGTNCYQSRSRLTHICNFRFVKYLCSFL